MRLSRMQFSQAPPLSGSNGSLVKTLQFTVRFGDFGLFSDQQFDSTIDSGAERSVRSGDVDLGQQRPTARLQRRRDPRSRRLGGESVFLAEPTRVNDAGTRR